MNTDIDYLQQLEADLDEAGIREAAVRQAAARARTARSRSRSRRWLQVAAVAVPILLVAGTIGGIASLSSNSDEMTSGLATRAPQLDKDHGVDEETGGPTTDDGSSTGDLSKIIRNGQIGIVVANDTFAGAVDRVGRIARANGGFVLSSQIQGNQRGTLVLRIPARRFDEAMETLRGIGIEVESETITGEDVTARFVDLTARARILSVRRAVLIRLQTDANTLDETLRLQGQLDDVQLKIEQIQGQIRFINNQVAEATLRVSVREEDAAAPEPDADVDRPSLGHSFELGIKGFLSVVGFVIVGLGYLVPVGVVLGAMWAVWFLARRSRGRGAGGE